MSDTLQIFVMLALVVVFAGGGSVLFVRTLGITAAAWLAVPWGMFVGWAAARVVTR